MVSGDFKSSLTKENLLKEWDFLNSVKTTIFISLNSNQIAINNQYEILSQLILKPLDSMDDLVETDICISKINAYIAIGQLNDVEDNFLELKYITRLPALFFNMHLNKLKILKSLKLTGEKNRLINLPSEIGLLHNLKILDLSRCGLKKIPKEIGQLRNLEVLNLDGNCFTAIPKEIGELPALKELHMASNPFLHELPDELGNLSLLELLDLHNDNIENIPTSVSQMHELREINLNNNQLYSLPESIGKLAHLEVLKLRHNRLRKLPAALLKMTCLKRIEIEDADEMLWSTCSSKFVH